MVVANSAPAATSQVTWTSQQDFELNEATTGDPTTRAGIDASSTAGSVQIGPKQIQNNGIVFGRFEGYGLTYNPITNRVYTSGQQSVSIMDGTTNGTVGFISAVGKTLTSLLTSTSNKIYAINTVDGSVVVYDGATDELIKSIAVAEGAQKLVYNATAEKIYVTHSTSNTVSVIDGNTDEVTNNFPVGTSPSGGVYNPANNRLYVMNKLDISVVDCSSEQVEATIPVLPSSSYFRMAQGAVNSSGSKVYASDLSSVVVIDTATNQITKTLVLAGWGSSTSNMVYDDSHDKLYLTISGSSAITVIDGVTDTVLRSVNLGAQYYGIPIAYSQSNNKVFAGDSIIDTVTDTVVAKQRDLAAVDTLHDPVNNRLYVLSDNVTAIDALTGKILSHIDTGVICYNGACTTTKTGALNTQGTRLYVIKKAISLYGTPHVPSSLAVVDTTTNQVLNSVPLTSDYPLETVYNSSNNQVYIFYPATNTATVHDGDSGALLKSITLSKMTSYAPKAVYHPGTNKIYVDGAVIDGATDTAIGTIPVTGRGTVDPSSSKIFFVYNGITTVDSSTDQVVSTVASLLPDKLYIDRVAFDAETNHFLAATNNTFYVLDAATGEPLQSVAIPASGYTKSFFNDSNRKAYLLRFNQGTTYGATVLGLSDYAVSGLLGGNAASTGLRSDTHAAAAGSTLFDTYAIRYNHAPLQPGQKIRFRVRTADDPAALASAGYFGADGTNRSWYDAATPGAITAADGGDTVIPLITEGAAFTPDLKRFVELEMELVSNGATPVVHEVKLELTTIDPPQPASMAQLRGDGTPILKATNNNQVTLSISGVPAGMYAEFEVRTIDAPFTGSATVTGSVADAAGYSTAIITLDEEKYHWQARLAVTPARKSLWSGFPGMLVIDTTPPALGINMQTIGGAREAGAVITVTGGAPMVIGEVHYPTETTWSCAVSDLAHGLNPATVTAADEAGNLSYTTFSLFGF